MAMYASTPTFSEMCMLPKVPVDVDLVIIEYGVNDLEYPGEFAAPLVDSAAMRLRLMTTSERRSLERIVR